MSQRLRTKSTRIGLGDIYCGVQTADYDRDGTIDQYTPFYKYGELANEWEEAMCYDELHKGPPYKEGGPLDIISMWSDQSLPKPIEAPFKIKGNTYGYEGRFLPQVNPTGYLDFDTPEAIQLNDWGGGIEDYGAKGWNRFRPTRSGVDLGVFLGELRDLPRMLKTTAKGFSDLWKSMGGSRSGFGPKSVANHWLNTQFGWFPFINDLQNFYKTCKNLDQALKQLERDNGRWVRRRGNVHKNATTDVPYENSTTVGIWPTPSKFFANPSGSRRIVRSTEQRIWFEGAFRYWIPGNPGSFQWKKKAIAMLFGLRPSPSLLWELTPFSWLVDWCANVGDAISNMSSIMFDDLCAKYAYVMGTTTQKVEYTGTAHWFNGMHSSYTWSASMTRKIRVEASPFGFGLTDGDFTARQWSILGALGITRLR